MTSKAAIEVRHLKKSFDDLGIIGDISFRIERGEKVSLLGPGGCGKSSVLKMILGILSPDAGEVYLAGTDMIKASDDEKQKTLRHVGMAFQQGALFDYMTVGENLTFAMENMTDLSKAQMKERIKFLLEGVKLGKTADLFPHELSGGMQRRVGIARALATDAEIAIFDEPTAGLDPVTSTIILNMINDLVGDGEDKTSLVCTSNVEIGIRYADRVIVLNEGVVAADGPWRELLLSGPEWVRHFLEVRLIGLDLDYAMELDLPKKFIEANWSDVVR